MANPRYISQSGEPTSELLEKMALAKQVFLSNLPWFCEKYSQDPISMGRVDAVYLIGSHADDGGWKNETSDLDLKIVNKSEEYFPDYIHRFKREVLKPLLCQGSKNRWIDLYFVQREDQVLLPRIDLTRFWNELETNRGE